MRDLIATHWKSDAEGFDYISDDATVSTMELEEDTVTFDGIPYRITSQLIDDISVVTEPEYDGCLSTLQPIMLRTAKEDFASSKCLAGITT